MTILIGFLYVLEVMVCLLLALVVMLQKPKEGGLGRAIGGGMLEASLGADAGSVLLKTTAVLGTIFMINTLVLARLTSTVGSGSVAGDDDAAFAPIEEVAPTTAPVATPAPVTEAPAPVAAPAPAAPAPAPAPVAAPAPTPATEAPASK